MVVVRRLMPGGTPEPADGSRAQLDREAAAGFLRAQADCLRHGLEHADDPLVVRAVLRAHDTGHEAWLSLIAAADGLGDRTVDVLAGLYEFHGRIVGALEQREHGVIDPASAGEVRLLLAARLGSRTDEALATLAHG